jgi:hypothetical protein
MGGDEQLEELEAALSTLPSPPSLQLTPGRLTQQHEPELRGYLIYGAEWCVFSRRARALLRQLRIGSAFVNVDEHGGSRAAVQALGAAEGYELLKGIPVSRPPLALRPSWRSRHPPTDAASKTFHATNPELRSD